LAAEATRIWAIGYSFAPTDRDDVVGLLRQAQGCKTFVVQNRPEAMEAICRTLEKKWLEPEGLNLKVEPFPQTF
jgi:hypothetical protein